MKRIIVAMTGASGTDYGTELLRALAAAPDVEPHLILSDAALKVMRLESDVDPDELRALAAEVYTERQIGAGPASGSWRHAGMAVCPCSMASLAAIANGFGANLIHRAADVALKEGRPLILVTRETPLNRVHMQNMLAAHDAGAAILPACPGFYSRPRTVRDIVVQVVARTMDQLGVEHELSPRWQGDNE